MVSSTELIDGANIILSQGDLSPHFYEASSQQTNFAIDIETSGLDFSSDLIGAIQVFNGVDAICIIRPPFQDAPLLKHLIADESKRKVFHHAMFDLRFLRYHLGVKPKNIACTKIAAKIVHPEMSKHSLSHLVVQHLNVELDKSLQTSNWLGNEFSAQQLAYAARDVIYLPRLLNGLLRLATQKRVHGLVSRSFEYIPTRVEMDVRGIGDVFVY